MKSRTDLRLIKPILDFTHCKGGHLQVLYVGFLNIVLFLVKPSPADDTATSPHQGNGAVVQLPAIFHGRLSQQHEPLGIRDYLGRIESLGTGHVTFNTGHVTL